MILAQGHGPNMLVRIAWFLFVGWWLGLLVSALAWLLNITIIGLPAGLWMINRLPTVITLRPQEQEWIVQGPMLTQTKAQHPFVLRALYFLVVGWWFSACWIALAYIAMVTVVLLPLAFWMCGRAGAVTTLYRS